MGAAWMMTLTTLNSTAQLNLPSAIRGRGMSLYVTTMSCSMAGGALIWGRLAGSLGVAPTITIAGVCLVFAAMASLRFRLE